MTAECLLKSYDWVLKLPKDTVFTVFDTETTGLSPETCKIIEVGAIRFNYRGPISEMDSFMNPECKIPPQVSAINHITDDMVSDAPTGAELMPKFLEYIGDTVLIAHNAKFDIDMVNAELDRLGLDRLKNRVIDTRWFAKDLFPDMPNFKLQTLAEQLKIDVKDAHRANDDSRVCMKLFLHCSRALLRRTLEARTRLAESK